MANLYKIMITVPDQKTFFSVLKTAEVTVDCGSPQKNEQGQFIVTLYASPAETVKLEALNLPMEVDREFTEKMESRLGEKFKEDRFQGGKIKFRGLGIKSKG